jgi:hypothetical protein
MKVTRTLASLVSLFLLAACGGGGGHGNGPTAPPQGSQIMSAVTLLNIGGSGIATATLSFDGQKIGGGDWSNTPGGCGLNCLLQGFQNNVPSGNHTLTITTEKLTGARGTFTVFGFVVVTPPSGAPHQVDLPPKQYTLQSGGKIDFPVSV